MNTTKLAALSLKILKHYIKYYNLPSNHAIEKSDLVTIIFNTRPLTNQNEIHYRSLRDKEYKDKIQALERQEQQEQNDGGDFIDNALNSVFNKFTDLFTADDENNNNTHHTSSSTSTSQQQYQQRYQSQNMYRPPPSHSQSSYQHSYNNNINNNYNNNNSSSARPGNPPRNQRPSPSQQRPPPSSSSTSSFPSSSSPSSSSSQRQQQQQQRATTENKPPSTTSTNTLTLNDILKASPPIDLSHLSVRTLKEILKQNHVELNFALEKKELVNRVQQLVDDQMKTNKENQSDIHEEILCRICFDAQQNCVFLNCQHMMACHDCGMKLVETKNECPICREPILQVIRIFRS
ncbi:unnamed protein product [Cunninghamella echinulata]